MNTYFKKTELFRDAHKAKIMIKKMYKVWFFIMKHSKQRENLICTLIKLALAYNLLKIAVNYSCVYQVV